ncbi:alpha/beta fold hydrolase [Dyella japonica]|uniref:Haloalkane dehalogenase n=1 Tax=Dyella japonica TaxID=231455 RepID=A0ABV2JTL0_9GAMM
MIPTNETFGGTFPYAARFDNASDFLMHYVDEGPSSASVILCLHGEPTWGYMFRHLIEALKNQYRVVVPDHMGFGKSETPQDRSYWLQDHIDNLERFVLSLDLRNITLVMHDFGGPVGMGLAARHPDRIARIVSVNGPTPFGQSTLAEHWAAGAAAAPWFQWIRKADSEGRLDAVLGELGFNILSTLKLNGFERTALINDTWLHAYGSHFVRPADCLGAIGWAKGVARDQHRFEEPTLSAKRVIASKPALAVWGMADRTLGANDFLPLFEELFPSAPIHRLPDTGHYSLEDAPEAIGLIISDFLATTEHSHALP